MSVSVTSAGSHPDLEAPAPTLDCAGMLTAAPSEAWHELGRAVGRLRKVLAHDGPREPRQAAEEARAALDSGLSALGGLAVRLARSLRTGSARW